MHLSQFYVNRPKKLLIVSQPLFIFKLSVISKNRMLELETFEKGVRMRGGIQTVIKVRKSTF